MKMKFAVIAMLASVTAAHAEVWSNSEYGCGWNKSSTDLPPGFESISYIDDSGMRGWEWDCQFGNMSISPVGNISTVADCTAEGDAYVETVTIDSLDGFGYIVQPLDGPAVWFKYKCE